MGRPGVLMYLAIIIYLAHSLSNPWWCEVISNIEFTRWPVISMAATYHSYNYGSILMNWPVVVTIVHDNKQKKIFSWHFRSANICSTRHHIFH
jgi:hypothetical protein